MSTARYSLLVCGLLAGGGCYYSQRPVEQPEPAPIGLHSPVRIWTGDSVETWHAVRLTPDSVSGVPYRMSVKCDSCRRSMSLGLVDSMKVGSPSTIVRGAEYVGAFAAFLVIYAEGCRALAPHDPHC